MPVKTVHYAMGFNNVAALRDWAVQIHKPNIFIKMCNDYRYTNVFM